jgi:hypothetical protein
LEVISEFAICQSKVLHNLLTAMEKRQWRSLIISISQLQDEHDRVKELLAFNSSYAQLQQLLSAPTSDSV